MVDKSADLFKLSAQIYESGLVEWVHPDFITTIKPALTPNDPSFSNQYYLNRSNDIDINAPKAWDITVGSPSVTVAVIDDGVENHPDLRDASGATRVLPGYSRTNNGDMISGGAPIPDVNLPNTSFKYSKVGHGLAVAGIISATTNNGIGISGIAPNTKILPINIFNQWERASGIFNGQVVLYDEVWWINSINDIVNAINTAKNQGAKVINMSIGTGNPGGSQLDALTQAINLAKQAGVIVVSSAMNANQPISSVLPAGINNHIVVGSIRVDGTRAGYSNYGPEMDLVGVSDYTGLGYNGNLTTLDREGTFTNVNNSNSTRERGYSAGGVTNLFGGTSASAPQIAGVAALMKSINPSLSPDEAEQILKQTAKNLPGLSANQQGAGLVRACEAVMETMNRNISFNTNQLPTSGGTVSLNGLAGVCATSATWAVVAGEEKLNPWSIPRSGSGSTTNTLSFQNTATGTITVRFTYPNPCSSTNVTKDQIIQIGAQITSGNCYRIKAKHSGKVLEVAGASTLNGIDVWQVSPVATNNQQIWKFESTSGGAYKLTAQHSGKVMDVLGSSLANLATVVQHDWNGGDNQQFLLAATGDGAFKIRPKHALGADKVFDIAYASTQDFSKVIQYDGHGGDNQRFYLENATCPVAGGGGGSGDNTCGMTLVSAWINCNTGNPNIANVIEAATIEGAGNEELQFKLDAGGLWYNNVWNIMNVSNGEHTLYVRKKNNTACVATKTITICGSGSGGGSSGGSGGGGGSVCPTPGCLNVQGVWYNHILKVLEGVTVGGGTGQYQFAIDNCNTWYDYQWSIQNLTVGMHTVYVRDKNNISCGGQFAFNVIPASNMRQGLLEDSQNVDATIENIIVYPNPSSKEVAIKFSEKAESELTFSLITVEGKVIKTDAVRSLGGNQSHKMVIEGLPSGQYFIMLKSPFSIKSTRLMIE